MASFQGKWKVTARDKVPEVQKLIGKSFKQNLLEISGASETFIEQFKSTTPEFEFKPEGNSMKTIFHIGGNKVEKTFTYGQEFDESTTGGPTVKVSVFQSQLSQLIIRLLVTKRATQKLRGPSKLTAKWLITLCMFRPRPYLIDSGSKNQTSSS